MFKNSNPGPKPSTISIQMLTIIAFLMALEIVLSRFLSINTPIVRIGFGFLPIALIAILYGPLWAGIAYALGDIIGAILFPTGPFFPGFTLSAFITGVVYGLFLYKKPVTWKSMLPASLIVCLLLNLALDTFWLYIIMGNGALAYIPMRITKAAIMIPLQVFVVPLVWNRVLSRVLALNH